MSSTFDKMVDGKLRQRDATHTFGEIFRTVRPALYASLTDPAAAWTNKRQMKIGFAYGTNYLIDLQRAIIVDVEATPVRRTAEVAATKTMLERTRECFGLIPT